ncbi:MAG: iron ABC transporter permease [Clostridia bacterium]|nr:iron ABC transporter permease [Clostridia bacterium]
MTLSRKNTIRTVLVFAAMAVLFVCAAVWNISIGSVKISFGQIFQILTHPDTVDMTAYNIIFKIRLPRLLLAAVLGGALSLSGFLLQTFFRNPIAGPFVLGISSGAKMFLAIVLIALSQRVSSVSVGVTVLTAFLGSMLSMLVVLAFAGKIKNMSVLLVVGIMISYICSAVTDFFINFANDSDIVNLTHWSHGSFSAASWQDVAVSAAIVLTTALAVFCLSKPISVYALGEGYAGSLGIRIKPLRIALILFSSVLSACVTAFAGPISFVGIAVPHIARTVLKTSKPILLIPACFFGGAVFCMLCDLAARTIFAPVELSISTVTAAIGAPIVIWLMMQRRVKHSEN